MILVNITEQVMITVIIVDMGVKGIVKVLKGSGEYMTENKRFRVTLESNTVRFVDFEENMQLMSISFKKYNDAVDCQNALKFQCDLLNELNDKNELFRQSREEYRKLSLHFERRNNELISDKAFLEKENEELKKELEIYRKVADCGNCHYHNYDWYDDGDYQEFEVCEKGNDMLYRICEEWSEL